MKKDLTILISIYDSDKKVADSKVLLISELKNIACSRHVFSEFFKYKSVTLIAPDVDSIPMPFMVACVCRLLTFGRCKWISTNKKKRINIFSLFIMLLLFIKDYISKPFAIFGVKNDILRLNGLFIHKVVNHESIKASYIRTDLPSNLNAGGSVGHIAGVLNNLKSITEKIPEFISSDYIPLIDKNINTSLIRGRVPNINIPGYLYIAYNKTVTAFLNKVYKKREFPDLIYHRYALDSYSVAKFCLKNNIPYILEYNGSELWILKHWSDNTDPARIKFPDISENIEDLVLKKALLITCVSSPLKAQLLEAGIPEERILVNPNGVNETVYYPEISGKEIRNKYGIAHDKTVIGFIGTFGAWHGAENLAKVYVDLVKDNKNIHLLMIGDGMKMPLVKDSLKELPEDSYTLTGMISQSEGAKHLAACDILVSPTVPNPDGTPFFGSPTKLFEYMAMGKAIVCSDMDQMAEILEHEKTALLCKPGDLDDLENCIQRLIKENSLRTILGKNARKEVVEKYTWKKHTEKIMNKFFELNGVNN